MEYQEQDFIGFDAGNRSVVRNNAISRDARLLFVILNSFSSTKDGCYISNTRLAFYMGSKNRAVQGWLTELKDIGAIKVNIINDNNRDIEIISKVSTGNTTTRAQACIPPCTNMHTPHAPTCTIGNRVEGIDLGNTPIAPKGGKYDADFEEFWIECPKKEAKPASKKRYIERREDGISKKVLLNSMKAYAKKCLVEKTEKHYIKHPYGWLNKAQERWLWDYTSVKPRTPVGGFKSTAAILAQEKQTEADKRRQQALFDKSVGLKPREQQLADQRANREWSNIAGTKDVNDDTKKVENVLGKLLGLQP